LSDRFGQYARDRAPDVELGKAGPELVRESDIVGGLSGCEAGKSLSYPAGFRETEASTMVDEKKETAAEKKISLGEVKKAIATSLGAAFGIVIGFLWYTVVIGGLKVAGVNTSLDTINLKNWIGYIIASVVLTVVLVVMIVVISRWGNK
jgi:hypothetical protein